MTRNTLISGLKISTLAIALVSTVSLIGCGTDLSTAPTGATFTSEEPGEMIRPTKDTRISAPRNFEAESLSGSMVQLTWDKPENASYTAVIQLDGVEIARVPATDSNFLDASGKQDGDHTYTLCFSRGQQSGRHATAEVSLSSQGGNDEDERNNKLPEQG